LWIFLSDSFSAKRNSLTEHCLYHTLIDYIVRCRCSGAIYQKTLELHTKILETSNLFQLKSHTHSFINGQESNMVHYFLGNLDTFL
jgi:hypothetical protein